jgi:small ligand-binding sensory domain FIST
VQYAFGHSGGASWKECVAGCLAGLGRPGRGLGFVYFTDALAGDSRKILDELKDKTGVDDWIGTVGTGIVATGVEYQEERAVAAMIADAPSDSYQVFSGRAPLRGRKNFAVVHADPAAPDVAGLVADMSAKLESGYLVGGLSSSRSRTVQIANEVLCGGLSGAAFSRAVEVRTRLTQGCVPYPGRFRVTAGEGNVVESLDGRPALDVLLETIGTERAQILIGIPVPGTDTGDYTARNLVGADPKSRVIAIGDLVEPGMEILFCRRDARAARADLERILGELARTPAPRGALYYSCVARGEHLFGSRGAELSLVREALGAVPLVGFFCNGEISRDRLYGYTGVLTLFS